MQPPHHHSRINLAELKAQIVKKLGPEGSKQYFYFLNRFLNLKLSKVEFNKLCLRIVGRENIPLHNQLIHSILRNACSAKAPPPSNQKDDVFKHGKDILTDGYLQNGSPGLSNGSHADARDRRTGDRRVSLVPNGKDSLAPHLPAESQSGDFNVVLENGILHPQQLQSNEFLVSTSCSRGQIELVGRDERSPLRAPLGVPLCPVSVGGGRRAQPLSSSSRCFDTSDNGALLDSLTLRERMQQIALTQGLEGVSLDSANILNHGLDAYMKGLIRSCIELVGSRSGHESTTNDTNKHHLKLINGVKPGHQLQMQEQRTHHPISLQDFRVAMEMNPRKLGENWSLLLEKICTHAFEE